MDDAPLLGASTALDRAFHVMVAEVTLTVHIEHRKCFLYHTLASFNPSQSLEVEPHSEEGVVLLGCPTSCNSFTDT